MSRTTATPAAIVGCYTMAMGAMRSLGPKGVPIIAIQFDKRDVAQRSRFVTETVKVPVPGAEEDGFIAALMELGARLTTLT